MLTDFRSFVAKRHFFFNHSRAILIAGVGFGFCHGIQALVADVVSNGVLQVRLSSLATLAALEGVYSIVFIVTALVLALIPSLVLLAIFSNMRSSARRLIISITMGLLLGMLFLPLCAAVAFFGLYEPSNPSYIARCEEFALPMLTAGVIGSYALLRFSVLVREKPIDLQSHPL